MREDEPFHADKVSQLFKDRLEDKEEEPEEKEKETYLPEHKAEEKWGQNKEVKKQKEKAIKRETAAKSKQMALVE